MSLESGWDFGDHLDDLMYCDSKWNSIKMILITIIFYPILILFVLPLSFLICGVLGFLSAGEGKKCDRCGKRYTFTCRSSNKFWDFCPSCNKKHSKLMDEFLMINKSKTGGK